MDPGRLVMNVVLITVDCLRADHLSCLGYHRKTSPFIDSLAQSGLLFDQAFVNGGGTFLSFMSLLSSTHPFMQGGREIKYRKTIGRILERKGYLNAGFNQNAFLTPYFGFDGGFSHFNTFEETTSDTRRMNVPGWVSRMIWRNRWVSRLLKEIWTVTRNKEMMGGILNRHALSWLERNCAHEFFLWLHYMDVHGPHYAPDSYFEKLSVRIPSRRELANLNRKLFEGQDVQRMYSDGRINEMDIDTLRICYDAEIRYVDDCLKEIYEKLTALGIQDNTILIITADHGEEFFEHGNHHSSKNLHDEMLRVPMIVCGPGIAAKKVDVPVQEIDIAPTMLDLLGEDCESSFMGESILRSTPRECIITESVDGSFTRQTPSGMALNLDFNSRKTAVRFHKDDEKWKYIVSERVKKEELYNLKEDPAEKVNLMGESREYRRMLRLLRSNLNEHIRMEEEQKRIGNVIMRIKSSRRLSSQ